MDTDRAGELDPRAAALAAMARGSLGHMSPTQRARGLEALDARLRRRAHGPRPRLYLSAATAVALATVVGFGAWRGGALRLFPARPLSYQVEGGAIGAAGSIEGAAGAARTVRFAEGTAVKLASGARGRLTSVDERGARFALDGGTAEVRVTPKPKARWLFDTGPFQIAVHGTAFTVAWDDSSGRLDVRLESGLVTVTGPVGGGPLNMHGGQHLTITLRQAHILLRDLHADDDDTTAAGPHTAMAAAPTAPPPPPTPAAAPAERPVPVRAPALRSSTAAARPVAHPQPQASWVAALAAGDLDLILRDAERDLPHALATRGSEDLAALASAARYRRRDDLARRTLLAQRGRFPQSARAADAAFLLGRLDDGATGGLQAAVKWYDAYLEEAPSGAYASEALGRKMVAVQKLHGTADARAVAEEYLRRFPSGTYAGAARALRATR
jgi:TolA-binding protein